MKQYSFLAFDLGATSGRTILGTLNEGKLQMKELTRFPNQILELGGHFYWNIYSLYEHLKAGMVAAAKEDVEIESIGIDTWGVDFAFLGSDGQMLGMPYAYRDPHTMGAPEEYFEKIMSRKEVYEATGIQVMSTNLLLPNETDPVIWRGPVISGVVQQFWTDVLWNCDYLFVDMPPGTGDVSLSVFQSIPLDGIVIVASPQELVSMVVEKAVKMAEMMEVPIVGLVENMSYVTCPDCGKQIHLFGQGKTAEAAERHHLPVLAEMPIDPALAALTDAGDIESFQGSWLEAAADKLEGK